MALRLVALGVTTQANSAVRIHGFHFTKRLMLSGEREVPLEDLMETRIDPGAVVGLVEKVHQCGNPADAVDQPERPRHGGAGKCGLALPGSGVSVRFHEKPADAGMGMAGDGLKLPASFPR